MFIGFKSVRSSAIKKRTLFFLFIPLYNKERTTYKKEVRIFGLCVYQYLYFKDCGKKEDICKEQEEEEKYYINNMIKMLNIFNLQKDINLTLNSISVNLSSLKKFENRLIQKFPELKK